MENERWVEIVGFEGLYSVSDQGRVRSERRVVAVPSRIRARTVPELVLKLRTNPDGYRQIGLFRAGKCKWFRVSRLVAHAFLGTAPAGTVVCHRDGDPGHDVPSNLRYDTAAGNEADKRVHGTVAIGTRHGKAKLTDDRVRALRKDPRSADRVAADFGVSGTCVRAVRRGSTWRHVE